MLTRLLVVGSLMATGMFAASAQTNIPPSASAGRPSVSAATHCRDSNGMVRLSRTPRGSTNTTGSASNTVESSSPGTSSSVSSTSGMPGSTEAEADLPPCDR
jgi:hypothetical protein